MEHQEIGIAADLVFQVGPLLPRRAGVAILLVVLSGNLVGDAFRDLLDPRLRRL